MNDYDYDYLNIQKGSETCCISTHSLTLINEFKLLFFILGTSVHSKAEVKSSIVKLSLIENKLFQSTWAGFRYFNSQSKAISELISRKKFFFWQKWQNFFSVYFFIFHHQHCSNEVSSSPSFVFVKLLIWNLKHSLPLSKSSTKLLLHLFSLLHCLDIFRLSKVFLFSLKRSSHEHLQE